MFIRFLILKNPSLYALMLVRYFLGFVWVSLQEDKAGRQPIVECARKFISQYSPSILFEIVRYFDIVSTLIETEQINKFNYKFIYIFIYYLMFVGHFFLSCRSTHYHDRKLEFVHQL